MSNTLVSTDWSDKLYQDNGDAAKTYLHKKGDLESVSALCSVFKADYLGLTNLSSNDLSSLYKSIWPSMLIGKESVFNHLSNNDISTLKLAKVEIDK